MARKTYKNILIVKMSSLGDIIHALPSLYALRKSFPEARITWAVHPAFAKILPELPWIDEIFLVDRKKIKDLKYLLSVRKELHSRKFDLVIDLQMIAKSAIIAAFSGCSTRIGYNDAREGSFLVSKPISGPHKHGHIIEQLLDVMRYLGCNCDEIEFPIRDCSKQEETVSSEGSSTTSTTAYQTETTTQTTTQAGTRGEEKKWPIEYWGELAKEFSALGIYTVISGTKNEKDLSEKITGYYTSSYIVDFVGETDLLELAALEKMASLHISSDTGPLHIANAMHTPIIALFGPTKADRSGPYGNDNSVILTAGDGKMSSIAVSTVYDKAKEILKL